MTQHTSVRPAPGFTLIELMITIAVVAILVSLAVPAYRDYTIRAKVTECINNAAVAKLGISEYRQTLGAWPGSLAEAGLASSGLTRYCLPISEYEASTGTFTIDINESAIDGALGTLAPVLEPTETITNVIMWNCKSGTTSEDDLKYLPSTCRDS